MKLRSRGRILDRSKMSRRQVLPPPLSIKTAKFNMSSTMKNIRKLSSKLGLQTTSMPSESTKTWNQLFTPFIKTKNHFSSTAENKSHLNLMTNLRKLSKSGNLKIKKEKARYRIPITNIVRCWKKSVASAKKRSRIATLTFITESPTKLRIKKIMRRYLRTKEEPIQNTSTEASNWGTT